MPLQRGGRFSQLGGLFGLHPVGVGRLLPLVQVELLQFLLHLVHLLQQKLALGLQPSHLDLALLRQLLGCRQGHSLDVQVLI